VKRGGADDRGSARNALHRTRGRPEPRLRARPSGRPSGLTRWLRHRPKLEVRRQAKLHLDGSSGMRTAGFPHLATAAHAQDGSALGDAIRRKAQRGPGCHRESSEPQGARDGSRLQKSVRRIFLVAKRPPSRRRRGGRRTAGWLEATRLPLTGQTWARSEREGARRGPHA